MSRHFYLGMLLCFCLAGCAGPVPGQDTGAGTSGGTLAGAPAILTRTLTDYRADYRLTGDWGSGFGATLNLTNTGSATVTDWQLAFDFPYQISTIWNARIVSHSGTRYVLAPESWNNSLGPGAAVSIGFNGAPGNAAIAPSNYSLTDSSASPSPSPSPPPTTSPSPSASPLPAAAGLSYQTVTDWGSGFQGQVTLKNTGSTTLTNWKVGFDLSGTVSSIWNASITGSSGGHYVVQPASWASSIPPGGSADFGFIASPGGRQPLNLVLTADGMALPSPSPSPTTSPSPSPTTSPSPTASPTPPGLSSSRLLVGYYPEWGIYQRNFMVSDIPAEQVDVVNYAFANIVGGQVAVYDSWAALDKAFPGDTWDQPLKGNFHQLSLLRSRNPRLKIMISVGGWTLSGGFSDVALTAASRQAFAASAVSFIKKYGFDGVDIDWEYPVSGGDAGNKVRPEDKHNFTLLLAELRRQLDAQGSLDGRKYYLSAALPAGSDKIQNLEVSQLGAYLDWGNLMAYDFHGGWENLTDHQAGLYHNPQDPLAPQYNVDSAVGLYLQGGLPASKLILGIPAYGRSWMNVSAGGNHGLFQSASGVPAGTYDATGVFDYKDLVSRLQAGGTPWTRYWDEAAAAPWLYAPSLNQGTLVTYEDVQSLGVKLTYLTQKGLGGVMVWDLSSDMKDPNDPNSLVGQSRRAFGPTR